MLPPGRPCEAGESDIVKIYNYNPLSLIPSRFIVPYRLQEEERGAPAPCRVVGAPFDVDGGWELLSGVARVKQVERISGREEVGEAREERRAEIERELRKRIVEIVNTLGVEDGRLSRFVEFARRDTDAPAASEEFSQHIIAM